MIYMVVEIKANLTDHRNQQKGTEIILYTKN